MLSKFSVLVDSLPFLMKSFALEILMLQGCPHSLCQYIRSLTFPWISVSISCLTNGRVRSPTGTSLLVKGKSSGGLTSQNS